MYDCNHSIMWIVTAAAFDDNAHGAAVTGAAVVAAVVVLLVVLLLVLVRLSLWL